MAGNWTDAGQAGVALTERSGPCKPGARIDLRQEPRELFFQGLCLSIEFGVAAGLVRVFFILAAADYAAVDSGAHVEIGIFRFPDEAFARPQMPRLRPRRDNPGRGDAVSMGRHDLRQLVTRTQHDLPRLDRESVLRQRQRIALAGLDVDDLVRREQSRTELGRSPEESRSERSR